MQSQRRSWKEALYSTGIGFTISIIVNWIVLWWQGYEPHFGDMGLLAAVMTIISVLRQYCVRRWFNRGDGNG